jgi:hypothetical protein
MSDITAHLGHLPEAAAHSIAPPTSTPTSTDNKG